ncbi:MAG: hypothetical protein E7262_09870 [Lachnospiraceae bacterium]|nr:hypothetical protein [Lachnospiraceae bacterium]
MNYDRIILELLDRVSSLEEEVKELKRNQNKVKDYQNDTNVNNDFGSSRDSYGRDTTKFILDGKRYGKGKLVHAIVDKYVSLNPNITASQLMLTFDRSLQGSYGVVRTLDDVKVNCSDYSRRFFTSPEYIIHTSTEDCVVCSQWGTFNIGNILARADQLGIEIQIIK